MVQGKFGCQSDPLKRFPGVNSVRDAFGIAVVENFSLFEFVPAGAACPFKNLFKFHNKHSIVEVL